VGEGQGGGEAVLGDLLADERCLRPHPAEGNWDSEDEAEEAGADEAADEVEEQAE